MAASRGTILAVADLIERMVPTDRIVGLYQGLVMIRGNKSFHETTEALARELVTRGHRYYDGPPPKGRQQHVCQHYRLINDKPHCVYCGNEMEL